MAIVNTTRLLTWLNQSNTTKTDDPLYQLIKQLALNQIALEGLLNIISPGGSSTTNITEIINNYMLMQSSGDGDEGEIGPPGLRGIDGAASTVAGPAGPLTIGPMGIDGQDGDDGYPIPGPTGPTGATGAAGSNAPLQFLKVTATQTINAGAGVYTDITELTFAVTDTKVYGFKFYIVFQSAATGTGWKSSVNCPTGTLDFFSTHQTVANSATVGVATWLQRHSVTRDDLTTLTSTITAGVDLVCMFEGRYICTADGTFAARFANELVTNTDIVIQIGSWGMYWEQ